jgi:hypothetical protein
MYQFKERTKPFKKDISVIPNGKTMEIEIQNVFHLKNVYKHLHDWLSDNGYSDPDTGKDDFETLYYELAKPDGLMFHHIWWRVLKDGEGTKGKYFKYYVKVNINTVAVTKHETMIEGKKFKTYKGDVIIKIKGYLRVDPADEWNNHPIIKHFQKRMLDHWLGKEISYHKKKLYAELVYFARMIKQYLGAQAGNTGAKQWNEDITGL